MSDRDFEKSRAHRRELVQTLQRQGTLHSARVAAAFLSVPREIFVPGLPLEDVYQPAEAIVVKRVDGATVSSASAPEVIALMLEQLDPRPGDRVLEIGAGTGYNAALLSHLVGEHGSVTSVDIDEEMVHVAREHLVQAGFDRVAVVHGDGALGKPDGSTSDRIILTAASNDIAPAWWQQLARPHGRVVMPLTLRGLQRCVAFSPGDGDSLVCRSLRMCAFITLRGALSAGTDTVPRYVNGRWVANGDEQSVPLPPAALAGVLSKPLVTQHTGVSLTVEQLRHGLQLWLVAHDRDVYSLWGDGRLPDLFGHAERLGARGTLCLLSVAQASLALLAWSDESALGGELSVLAPAGADALGERLAGLVHEWVVAGYPMDTDAEIHAYPRAHAALPVEREVAIDQRWTRFVLRWRSPIRRRS